MRRTISITSRILCTLGLLIIFAALVDYLTLLLPLFESNSAQQRLAAFHRLVSQGSVPFAGIIFLLAGSWVAELRKSRKITGLSKTRLISFVCACSLSLMFFLLIHPYTSDVRAIEQQAISAIEREANQMEQNIEDTLTEQSQQERSRSKILFQDENAIANRGIQNTQIVGSQQLSNEANSLYRPSDNQAKSGQEALKADLQKRRQEAIQKVESSSLESIIQTKRKSLWWAITYAILCGLSLVNPSILRSQSREY